MAWVVVCRIVSVTSGRVIRARVSGSSAAGDCKTAGASAIMVLVCL
jgi:hypothetical protein